MSPAKRALFAVEVDACRANTLGATGDKGPVNIPKSIWQASTPTSKRDDTRNTGDTRQRTFVDRIAFINAYLAGASDQIGVPKAIEERLWPFVVQTTGADVHRPLGFLVQQYMSYDEKWVFFYCPEVMADSVSFLSDGEFERYLSYVREHLKLHIELCDEPPDDIEEAITERLAIHSAHAFVPMILEKMLGF